MNTSEYRYTLGRSWDEALPVLYWVMHNPSTADDENDDPTIRRCIQFAKDNGFGGIQVRNLFALRATNPKDLLLAKHARGPMNHTVLSEIPQDAIVVCAWGNVHRDVRYKPYINGRLFCLGKTKDGNPKHPLYVKSSQQFIPFKIY